MNESHRVGHWWLFVKSHSSRSLKRHWKIRSEIGLGDTDIQCKLSDQICVWERLIIKGYYANTGILKYYDDIKNNWKPSVYSRNGLLEPILLLSKFNFCNQIQWSWLITDKNQLWHLRDSKRKRRKKPLSVFLKKIQVCFHSVQYTFIALSNIQGDETQRWERRHGSAFYCSREPHSLVRETGT